MSDFSLQETELKNIETAQPPPSAQMGRCRKILKIMDRYLKHNGDWLEQMRGNLSLVATVISTITFQALNNPPGGFVQLGIKDDDNDPLGCIDYKDGSSMCPGDAVSAIKFPYYFHPYMKYNTIAFISSITVVLILISGVPLKHKVVMWMLSMGMCITLTFLTLTYLNGLYMVTPNGDLFQSAYKMVKVSLKIWIGVLGFTALLITVRFIIWLAKKIINWRAQKK